MPQIFHRRSNALARFSIAGFLLLVIASFWGLDAIYWSPFTTRQNAPIEQSVPFSHQHHVAGLGIDCRYCHTSVEKSAFAGIPPTETCMTCHSQLWTQAPVLAPVRQSLAEGKRLRWNRVNDLPDFVFFNHSIHVAKGVGCVTCHGAVDKMPLTWKAHSLYMKWCLECHQHPEKYLRPTNQVFNLHWTPPEDQRELGAKLVQDYHVNTSHLTDCSICHR